MQRRPLPQPQGHRDGRLGDPGAGALCPPARGSRGRHHPLTGTHVPGSSGFSHRSAWKRAQVAVGAARIHCAALCVGGACWPGTGTERRGRSWRAARILRGLAGFHGPGRAPEPDARSARLLRRFYARRDRGADPGARRHHRQAPRRRPGRPVPPRTVRRPGSRPARPRRRPRPDRIAIDRERRRPRRGPPSAVGVHTGRVWLGPGPGSRTAAATSRRWATPSTSTAHLCAAAGAGHGATSTLALHAAGRPRTAPTGMRLKRRQSPVGARLCAPAAFHRCGCAAEAASSARRGAGAAR